MKTEVSDLAVGQMVAQVTSQLLGRGPVRWRGSEWAGIYPISDDGRGKGVDRVTPEELVTLGALGPS